MVAYGEFRMPYKGVKVNIKFDIIIFAVRNGLLANIDQDDNRFVFCGMRYLVETYLHRRWTMEDIAEADRFYATHNAGFTHYPWPKELFEKFVRENDGYFPVRIQALAEGTC